MLLIQLKCETHIYLEKYLFVLSSSQQVVTQLLLYHFSQTTVRECTKLKQQKEAFDNKNLIFNIGQGNCGRKKVT